MRRCAICFLKKPDACFPRTSRCTQCEASNLGVGSMKRLKRATTQVRDLPETWETRQAKTLARWEMEAFVRRGARVIPRTYVRHTSGCPVNKRGGGDG